MTTLTYNVAASTDDGDTSNRDDAARTDLTRATIEVGSVESGTPNATSGFRFTGVAVTQGTIITSATLVLTCSTNYHSGGTINVKGSCHAADNAGTFAASPTKTFEAATRPRTAQTAGWDVHNWVQNTEYSLVVTVPVQAIISRAGFVSGNAIVVLLDDNGSTAGEWQDSYSWNDAANRAKDARLVIVVPDATFVFKKPENTLLRM